MFEPRPSRMPGPAATSFLAGAAAARDLGWVARRAGRSPPPGLTDVFEAVTRALAGAFVGGAFLAGVFLAEVLWGGFLAGFFMAMDGRHKGSHGDPPRCHQRPCPHATGVSGMNGILRGPVLAPKFAEGSTAGMDDGLGGKCPHHVGLVGSRSMRDGRKRTAASEGGMRCPVHLVAQPRLRTPATMDAKCATDLKKRGGDQSPEQRSRRGGDHGARPNPRSGECLRNGDRGHGGGGKEPHTGFVDNAIGG